MINVKCEMLSVKLAFLPTPFIYKDLNFCRWTVNLSDSFNYLLRKLDRQMFFWVEEHGGADAVFAVGAMEHIYVDATLATTPERLVIGQVGESNWKITQLGVHLHDSRTGSQRENLGMRPSLSGERKGQVLDALCQSQTTEVWVNDQT